MRVVSRDETIDSQSMFKLNLMNIVLLIVKNNLDLALLLSLIDAVATSFYCTLKKIV